MHSHPCMKQTGGVKNDYTGWQIVAVVLGRSGAAPPFLSDGALMTACLCALYPAKQLPAAVEVPSYISRYLAI